MRTRAASCERIAEKLLSLRRQRMTGFISALRTTSQLVKDPFVRRANHDTRGDGDEMTYCSYEQRPECRRVAMLYSRTL